MYLPTTLLFIEQPKTWIFIVLILVLFFGAKRIPELMRGLGQGVREFKNASVDADKAPQTHQPYSPPQPSYQQPPYQQQPGYPVAGQPAYAPPAYPTQPPAPAYPSQPQAPYGSQPAPTTPDAGGQPLA